VDLCLIAAIEWEATIDITVRVLKVAVGLGFVIFVHELGHFLVAKACGGTGIRDLCARARPLPGRQSLRCEV